MSRVRVDDAFATSSSRTMSKQYRFDKRAEDRSNHGRVMVDIKWEQLE